MKNNRTKKSKITVHPIGVCDIYEVGNWPSTYSFIKLGYELDKCDLKCSDIGFLIRDKAGISGYAIHKNAVIVDRQDALPIYSKKMVLCDFAISARAYAKYGKILIDHMINYARQNGYIAIEVKKEQKFSFFLEFLSRHFNARDIGVSLYIFIKSPKIKSADRHLRVYDEDSVAIEDLYFLRYTNFTVRKTVATLKLTDNESIAVDRKSGRIKFPLGVQSVGDEVTLNDQTRSLICMLKEIYGEGGKSINVCYDAKNRQFEAFCDGALYLNKSIEEISGDIKFVLAKVDCGVKSIYSYMIEYDMNDAYISYGVCGQDCFSFIEKYSLSCLSNASKLVDKVNEKRKANEFNLKLQNVSRFDFRFGNPFSGIKKLSIDFGDRVEIHSNGRIEKQIIPQREEIIKELSCFNFSGWKEKYDGNAMKKTENCWSVRLIFPEQILEYEGCDDYPQIWDFVEWFVNKYSRFTLTKE